MSTRLHDAKSALRQRLPIQAGALLLTLALGIPAALRAQAPDKPPAGTFSLIYSFQGPQFQGTDGCLPEAGLVRDAAGNLYGTTLNGGGQFGYGTVFKVTPDGTESVLHSFAGAPSDGRYPQWGSLTLDAAGNLYGTTYNGGEFDSGTVFKVTATGSESILYSFCAQAGCADGADPAGGIARDPAGNLYGTTVYGGTDNEGVVFRLPARGTEKVLHNFARSTTDGGLPYSNLTRDSSGNLYGTTDAGGTSDAGTVFEVSASGAYSVLYNFRGFPDGLGPFGGGLLRDPSGNLYGVTESGGASDLGVLFELSAGGTESVLLNFNGTEGRGPLDGLARDGAGSLYGTTEVGGSGAGCALSCGVLFKLTTTGREFVLHNFTLDSASDGAYPVGGVIRDSSGNLYGTLEQGGAYGCGAVFKYAP